MKDIFYTREQWFGDSRDGIVTSGEGWHYFKMTVPGKILEAYEVYETEAGDEIVTPLPDLAEIDWIHDFGFEDLEALEKIDRIVFDRVKASHPLNAGKSNLPPAGAA